MKRAGFPQAGWFELYDIITAWFGGLAVGIC
jgi:hypothetical protein